jgi:hypothetical protein
MFQELFTPKQIQLRDIDTLKKQLREKLGGYTVAIKNVPAGTKFFRGVRNPELPKWIEQISYPKASHVTRDGRANRRGIPMFYCSVGGPAVFYEMRIHAGDKIALSEWELIESIWMHNLGYHRNALSRLGSSRLLSPRQHLINPIPNETKPNRKLRRKLSFAFTDDVDEGEEYKYKLSIAIHELLFDGAAPIEIIGKPDAPRTNRAAGTVYPAMKMKGAADNAVIWPEFVDRCLKLKSVRYVLVEEADESNSAYKFQTIGYSNRFEGDKVLWSEELPDEAQRRSSISFEDGTWMLRDWGGRIYFVQ